MLNTTNSIASTYTTVALNSPSISVTVENKGPLIRLFQVWAPLQIGKNKFMLSAFMSYNEHCSSALGVALPV